MPEHYIEISLPKKPIRNVDTTIAIWSDGEKLGTMHLSQGSLDWRGGRRQKVKSFSWEKIAKILNRERSG